MAAYGDLDPDKQRNGSLTAADALPPTIYLVRHGDGEHNLEHRNWIHDARLTDKGKAQCRELRDNFPDHERISAVICSPLRRAVQSAAIAFAPAINRERVEFIAHPLG
ncbi:hypothetical protein ABEF95_013966 [Exophiala dermatitidis]